MTRSLYDVVWDETFWFPGNQTFGWKDLEIKPGSSIYLPNVKDLNLALGLGVVLIGIRYLIEKLIVVPVALKLGISNKGKPSVVPNEHLEKVYKARKHLKGDLLKGLAKQTDMTERQIEVWFRNRKKMDLLTPMQKFAECSWHLAFYTAFFIYGMVYLWKKDYFWKSIECWRHWPVQDVTSDMYWHYLLELGFYWSLVFTLFSDNKRKDFKEMIVHHFATIVLIYFSWLLNFVRVGTLVLAVHDAADTWLALAKMSIYAKNKMATDIFFGIFLVVWIVSRLIVYPYVILYCTTVEPFTIGLMDHSCGAYLFFNFFLYLLLILHLIWTYLIFRILYRKIVKGNVEDVRSDSEESDEEFTDENDDQQKTDVSNGFRKSAYGVNGDAARG